MSKRFDSYQDQCPICESKMIKETSKITCKNKCYGVYFGYGYKEYYVFDKRAATIWADDNFFVKRGYQHTIETKIKYWKENNRYLMKILEVENE